MKKKKYVSTVILIVVLFVGISLLLYPTVSDYWNSFHQSQAVAGYAETVADLKDDEYVCLRSEADAYNQTLLDRQDVFNLSDVEQQAYENVMDVTGTGIMAYIEIPKIHCILPIYHGTDESVLQVAIGHIPGSSLPVGGVDTHCVLSGHRGLPSARLFTDLDELAEGDLFFIHVLNDTLTYEVDQILIVEPDEVEALAIARGEDYCTLVTCTPYGVNTHRLLVRGHRMADLETDTLEVSADMQQVDLVSVVPILVVSLVVIFLLVVLVRFRKRK